METPLFIARIVAVIYLAVGLGFLLNGDYYCKVVEGFTQNAGVTYLGGLMALTIGFLIIYNHNVWENNWTVLITIIGWMALTKGLLILIFPKKILEMSGSILKMKSLSYFPWLILLLSLVFGYFGFVA